MNDKRGLFLASVLTNTYAEKFHYGYRTNKKAIQDLKIKLPVIQEGDKKGEIN